MKTYEIKLYTAAGALIKTIERENILSTMSFSGAINAGLGELSVLMAVNSLSASIAPGNIAQVLVFSDNYPTGKVVYTGVCTIREYRASAEGKFYNFTFLGLQFLLSKIYYTVGGIYTTTKTGTAGQIIKDIIDFYNSLVGFSWFSTTNIDLSGPSVNLALDYTYALGAINTAAKTRSGYYLYVDGSGAVYYRQKSSTPDSLLTFGADVDSIVLKQNVEDLVNGHFVRWSGGIRPENADAPSKALYFTSQLIEDKTELNDTTTADNYSAAYLAKAKNPTSNTTAFVNTTFQNGLTLASGSIEELIPGDTVTILNTDETIINLQIYKIKYDIRGLEIELESINTLGFLLSN